AHRLLVVGPQAAHHEIHGKRGMALHQAGELRPEAVAPGAERVCDVDEPPHAAMERPSESATTRLRPRRFASESASSARATSVSTLSGPSSRRAATPALTVSAKRSSASAISSAATALR